MSNPKPTTATTTTVSAPGKILLAGGYLVLESPHVGVVLAVDKKFYSTVVKHANDNDSITDNDKDADEPSSKKPKVDATTTTMTVNSPQFGATWKYVATNLMMNDGGGVTVQADASVNNQSTNLFVEKTLRLSVAYLVSTGNMTIGDYNLEITILADNDFYSVTPHLQARKWDATPENLQQLPRFLPCNLSGGSLQKTGLGSSAALVTSLVGALVLAFRSSSQTTTTIVMDDVTRRRIHNLAQICHCHAQGKVGSGFDVSSASFGSHVYQRFPKCLLSDLLQELDKLGDNNAIPKDKGMMLQHLVEESPENYKWPGGVVKPLSWNTNLLQIMLADVSGGSESPSMARKILSWKAASDDISCWTNLAKLNERVVVLCDDIVRVLNDHGSSGDDDTIANMTQVLSRCNLEDGWAEESNTNNDAAAAVDEPTKKVGDLLCELRKTLLDTRKNLKTMGDLAGVPVEPDEQTKLADATMELPGVVASLVPGAGGYDALVVVYVNKPEVRDQICNLWTNYKPLAVCPLAVQFASYGDGLKYEAETPRYKHLN